MTKPLYESHCKPCKRGAAPLSKDAAKAMLVQVPGWNLSKDSKFIQRSFKFKEFLSVMNFVNAVAYIANKEEHHPDVQFGYDNCDIVYSTDAVGGLSENDFICAAKVNHLLQ